MKSKNAIKIKHFFIFLSIVLLSSSFVSAGVFDWITGRVTDQNETVTKCTDSDDGKIYDEKGKTCVGDICKIDYCFDAIEKNLMEYYCQAPDDIRSTSYKCPNGCKDGACLKEEPTTITKEQVKCVFTNSVTKQKCYTAEDNSRFSCSGAETCVIDVSGKKGEELTWKSSCGGYAYTTIDGINEYAEFDCSTEVEPTCKDSDGGEKIFVKGTTKDEKVTRTDLCRTDFSLFEYICSENNEVKTITYECAFGCEEGKCTEDLSRVPKCSDSDGGVNFFLRGDVTNGRMRTNDHCATIRDLQEWSCTTLDYLKSFMYECPNGCENGVCIQEDTEVPEENSCKDSDGDNPFREGSVIVTDDDRSNRYSDRCVHKLEEKNAQHYASVDGVLYDLGCKSENCYVAEAICQNNKNNFKVYECPTGCQNGACLTVADDSELRGQCKDSDVGKDYYSRGYVIGEGSIFSDKCALGQAGNPDTANDPNLLFEAYCFEGKFGYGYDYYSCPHGCEDGACLPFYGEKEEIEIVEEEIKSSIGCPKESCKTVSIECAGKNRIFIEKCTYYIEIEDKCEKIESTKSRIKKDACIEEETQIIFACQGCQLDKKTCIPFGTRLEAKGTAYYCDINKNMIKQKENVENCQNSYECSSNNCKGGICKPICEGCLDENNVCIPLGTRTQSDYCDVDSSFKSQKSEGDNCNNYFECSSSLCLNNQCISPTLIQKIINWFTRLFG